MQTTVSLGIDIGGTNIAFGIIDKSGNCLANGSLPTTAYNTPQDFVQEPVQNSEERTGQLRRATCWIGVGAPNGTTSTEPSKMRQTYLGKGPSRW